MKNWKPSNSKELNANGETALGLNVKLDSTFSCYWSSLCDLVVMGNVLIYLFNPTINRAGDFLSIKLICNRDYNNCQPSRYPIIQNAGQELTIVSSNKAILDKLKQNQESLKGFIL